MNRPAALSILVETLKLFILDAGLPTPTEELRFAPPRRWRFDLAYPEHKLAIECEGGTLSGGRHVRGFGYEKDCEKYNEAQLLGWTVLRFTKAMIDKGVAIETIRRAWNEDRVYRLVEEGLLYEEEANRMRNRIAKKVLVQCCLNKEDRQAPRRGPH